MKKNIKLQQVKNITKKAFTVGLVLTMTAGIFSGCGSKADDKTIKVGASPSPHAEILEQIKDDLKKDGYNLNIVEYNDYVIPNKALNDGEIDANYFQHTAYLENYNKENKTDLVEAGKIHFEPLGIYSKKIKSLSEIKDGDVVIVPNDATNEARALLLLQEEGIIKVDKKKGFKVTKLDVTENPKHIEIKELAAEQLPRALDDAKIGVINGNYAIDGGLKIKDALSLEKGSSDATKVYSNIIAVRKNDKNNEKTKALVKALKSEKVKKFIEKKYKGSVITVK
ncbi:MetQ/NlpA family ABC transporter substrate-binding protein [Lachnobacterium bovis]|uniref:Lipoprotein n=1 Tax=Lachnobacterium bovis TaxID=140626 RepID=A0A1H9TE09_9FIRM|nr:MetQ/NlpA family ABC transporter substrate-binding protein [Lachnobacterium bovis]SER95204.1 D-methionine transport system substrate-binding protein [Lachnobacterium bovis]